VIRLFETAETGVGQAAHNPARQGVPMARMVVNRDEEAAIRGHGATCDPRAIASGRPRSHTGSHGHSAVASTKARGRDLCWSED
jgi:hypothetical protein